MVVRKILLNRQGDIEERRRLGERLLRTKCRAIASCVALDSSDFTVGRDER